MLIDAKTDRDMIGRLRPRPARRSWMQLLSAVLSVAGKGAELVSHAERPWNSVTFSGTRHTIALAFNGDDAVSAGEAFIEAIPDHEFTLSRQIVVDAVVTSVDRMTLPEARLLLEVEFLLLDEE
jgi:hypothetical protein